MKGAKKQEIQIKPTKLEIAQPKEIVEPSPLISDELKLPANQRFQINQNHINRKHRISIVSDPMIQNYIVYVKQKSTPEEQQRFSTDFFNGLYVLRKVMLSNMQDNYRKLFLYILKEMRNEPFKIKEKEQNIKKKKLRLLFIYWKAQSKRYQKQNLIEKLKYEQNQKFVKVEQKQRLAKDLEDQKKIVDKLQKFQDQMQQNTQISSKNETLEIVKKDVQQPSYPQIIVSQASPIQPIEQHQDDVETIKIQKPRQIQNEQIQIKKEEYNSQHVDLKQKPNKEKQQIVKPTMTKTTLTHHNKTVSKIQQQQPLPKRTKSPQLSPKEQFNSQPQKQQITIQPQSIVTPKKILKTQPDIPKVQEQPIADQGQGTEEPFRTQTQTTPKPTNALDRINSFLLQETQYNQKNSTQVSEKTKEHYQSITPIKEEQSPTEKKYVQPSKQDKPQPPRYGSPKINKPQQRTVGFLSPQTKAPLSREVKKNVVNK